MSDGSNKVVNFLKLLQFNEDYSKVLSLKNLISYLIVKNKIFKENFDKRIPREITKRKINFFDFLNKTIVCFPNNNNLKFDVFLYQVETLDKINLNSNNTINDVLAESMIELLKSNSFKETYSYCQLIGIQMEAFYSANQNAFKNSNRLLSTADFENFRLLIGDDVLSYIMKFCSLFFFDDKLQNYIQLLGFSLKEKLNKLFTGQTYSTKFASTLNLTNFSMKSNNFNNSNNNLLPMFNSNSNLINNGLSNNQNCSLEENNNTNFQNKKVYIPIQNFNIERTKIFYCTNFNRKLGLFKNSIFTKSKNKDLIFNKITDKDSSINNIKNYNVANNNTNGFNGNKNKNSYLKNITNINLSVNTMYNRIFENYTRLIPINIETDIRKFLEFLNRRIAKYEYHKRIFICCPTRNDWKEFKVNLKKNLEDIKNTNLKEEEEKKIQEEISKAFTYLLSSTVDSKFVFKFIKDFLNFCLPKDLLGEDNYSVLLDKLKTFISLNRFETFNKINLFDSKEFSFKGMNWLEFNGFSKTTYREIGTNLKNFIMKNIIHWLFDFLIVQLIRSHFYVTEKQGDHYKTFYYHKKDWDMILKINEIKFKHQFSEINKKEAIEVLYQKDLTFGKLRLVPKPATCRPIISYKKRTMRNKNFIKNTLFETQKVFKYLSNLMQYKNDNCVVFDYKAIIQKMRKFKFDLNEKIHKFVEKSKECFKDEKLEYNGMEVDDSSEFLNNSNSHGSSENINDTNNYLEALKRMNYQKIEMGLIQKNENQIITNLSNNDKNFFNYSLVFNKKINLHQEEKTNSNQKNISYDNFNNLNLDINQKESILSYSTLDIEGCYDNIDIERMIKIIDTDDIISEVFASNTLYVILPKPHMLNKKFNDNVRFKDCFEMKKLFFVSDNSEYIHFFDFLRNRNDLNYSYCVLYPDYTNMSYLYKKDIIPRIKDIIKNNIIKFNKKFFKQTKGIPQGLSISSFLCNLYFYNIEKYLCREYCKANPYSSKLLLRFMDDYICVSTKNNEVKWFVEKAKNISKENTFNFNMKKSKNNLDMNRENPHTYTEMLVDSKEIKKELEKINFEDLKENKDKNDEKLSTDIKKKNKFNWNGINFEMGENFNFNMFIDSKENYDLKQYSTLININLPALSNKNDYNWIYKKICSIFLTGHPWVYFITELNSVKTLLANFRDFVQVITFKLIIFTNVLSNSSLKPSQKQFIEILDTCLKKLYFYFNNKLIKAENKLFFLKDFEIFVQTFYLFMYEIFENNLTGKLNDNIIKPSPYLFKCIRRKILRIKSFRDLNDEKNFVTEC